MNLHEIVAELRNRGIRMWLEEGELRFAAPKGAMDEDLRERLRACRAELVTALSQALPDAESPIADRGDCSGELSFAQQRLLFLHRMDAESPAYNLPHAVRIRGAFFPARLQSALDALVRRHDAARTCFRTRDGEFVRICEADASLELREVMVPGADIGRLDAMLREEARRVFDLGAAPLIRAVLYRLGEDDHVLMIVMHHAVSDGWSIGLIMRELWADYAGMDAASGPVASGDAYVGWQRQWLQSQDYRRQKAYWIRQLAGTPGLLDLPLDAPRPAVQNHAGAVQRFAIQASVQRSIEALASAAGASAYMVLTTAFFVLLHRLTGQHDLTIGTPVANRRRLEWENAVGFFSNVVVLRQRIDPLVSFERLLRDTRETCLSAFEHQEFPFEQVVEHLQVKRSLSHSPLFQTMFIFQDDAGASVPEGLVVEEVDPCLGVSKFDMTLTVQRSGDGLKGGLEYATALFAPETAQRICDLYVALLSSISARPGTPVGRLDIMGADERAKACHAWNPLPTPLPDSPGIDALIVAQALRTPDIVALSHDERSLTYRQLVMRATDVADALRIVGIGPDDRVGIHLERGIDLVVSMLGVLMAGAAYVPLDPGYPQARIAWIAQDAGLSAILHDAAGVPIEGVPALEVAAIPQGSAPDLAAASTSMSSRAAEALAYVIYTSGSTGRPKGVMVSHRNVINLFEGLDDALAPSLPRAADDGRPVWMALTSISFDISVLELLWTLARGHHVMLQKDHLAALPVASAAIDAAPLPPAKRPELSLFYFASDEDSLADKYRLLMEGARFADDNGFLAVWVPERHFHSFGGQFPNPSIAAAAVAAVTRRIGIRAGSCVLPLHDPIRVAEEWSMVDNLSGGRAAVAFASGWHFNDFVLAPERFETRHEALRQGIESVRSLWRGGGIARRDGRGQEVEIRIRPRPLQPELPVWITAAASPDTFRYAGEIGANVLTHLLGQSLPELKEKIDLYRRARAEHGHDPAAGRVTLMLHTCVGEDEAAVREIVREPFKSYLRSSINLLKPVAESQGLDAGNDLELVVEAGFKRYSTTSALFGTPESCRDMIWRITAIGVDEIGCLIDFGVDHEQVIASFPAMARLRALVAGEAAPPAPQANPFARASHLQCTPSFARMLLDQAENHAGTQTGSGGPLAGLRGFLVGGEALSSRLAADIKAATGGELFNMYGPTETTVWSAVRHVREDESVIGAPIANTRLYVLDPLGELCPIGVKGELYIGGDGVARGYWRRPELTAERFVPDPYSGETGARLYRTGDLVRRLDDGTLEFIARIDDQVKVRGYRVELGEIEAALLADPAVREAVVVLHGAERHEAAIHAYIVAAEVGAQDTLDVQALLRSVAARLPSYMVPSMLQILPALPLTPNGKVDRKALPAIVRHAGGRPTESARNETEEALSAIWCELLSLEAVGINDNFFELGGHSLLLGKLQKAILDRFGRDIGIIELFKYPTIASLAAMLAEDGKAAPIRHAAQRSRSRQDEINQVRERMKNRKQHAS